MPLLNADADPRCGECGTQLQCVQPAEKAAYRIVTPAVVGGGLVLLTGCLLGAWWMLRTPKENAAEVGGAKPHIDSTPGLASQPVVVDRLVADRTAALVQVHAVVDLVAVLVAVDVEQRFGGSGERRRGQQRESDCGGRSLFHECAMGLRGSCFAVCRNRRLAVLSLLQINR